MKYVVISPCRDVRDNRAYARGEAFPADADAVQIDRLQKAGCLLPESDPVAKLARGEFERAQAGQQKVARAAEREREAQAAAEAARAQVISEEIAAAEKRRDEALMSAEQAEATHTARLGELQLARETAERDHAERLQQLDEDLAGHERRGAEAKAAADEAEQRLQDLELKISDATAELAKKPTKKA